MLDNDENEKMAALIKAFGLLKLRSHALKTGERCGHVSSGKILGGRFSFEWHFSQKMDEGGRMKTKQEIAEQYALLANTAVVCPSCGEASLWTCHVTPFLAGYEAAEKVYEERLKIAEEALLAAKDDICECAADTLWHGPVETTVDFIDNALSKIRGEQNETT